MTDWRPQIAHALAQHWPTLGDGVWWIAAQVEIESAGDPRAVSPKGAQGLLQLMPGTWADLAARLRLSDVFDPEQNLAAGVVYLRDQYDRLAEVPVHEERLRWALCSYNCGRGYVNRAFALARLDGQPLWWKWEPGRYWLFHRACIVQGRAPEYREAWGYVAKITDRAQGGM